MPELDDGALDQSGKAKRKDKVRSVWISFVGRIVAQIIGAIASVVLGIFILQRYQDSPAVPAPATPAAAPAPRAHGQQALAVLPLDNFSRDPDDAYFALGMTEVLISDLAQIKGWRVISRTSTEAYRGSNKSIAQIGTELNVDLIVGLGDQGRRPGPRGGAADRREIGRASVGALLRSVDAGCAGAAKRAGAGDREVGEGRDQSGA
jgi:hypothetical protein